jgi:hypothetical protein
VLLACADIHAAFRARGPPREFASVSDLLVEDVDGATPHMEVLELRLGPSGAGEQVKGRETGASGWHPVPYVGCLMNSHRPERGVGDFAPVDGRVEQHGSSDGHDCPNGSLGSTILVVCSGARDP